jgi:hypothetical protein
VFRPFLGGLQNVVVDVEGGAYLYNDRTSDARTQH